MSEALYRKYRPKTWDEILGQAHVVQTIRNAVRNDRLGHAYLFAGPRGTGKTTMARLLAKAANCTALDLAERPCDQCVPCAVYNENRFLDLIEIDAASNTSVDDVRDLRDKINYSPSLGVYRVYIIDEVHMLSNAAFNALLKTLEEPPKHAIFILATTEVYKIPATVLSRCQRHEFRRIPVNEIKTLLDRIIKEEGFSAEENAITLIARQSTGSMRDAISLLDQIASTGEKVTLEAAQEILGTATSKIVVTLVDAILQGDAREGLKIIAESLDGGSDARQLARQVVDYLRDLLLVKNGNIVLVDATQENHEEMTSQAEKFSQAKLLACLQAFNQAAINKGSSWFPGLALELALVETIEGKETASPFVVEQARPEAITSHDTIQSKPSSTQPAGGAAIGQIKREKQPQTATTTERRPATSDAQPDRKKEIQEPSLQSGQGNASYELIEKNWEQIKAAVKDRRGTTEGLLNSIKTKSVREGALILGFASDIVKQKMESEENIQITHQAILDVLGVDIPITCIALSKKVNDSAVKLDIEGDGMVGEAINLGGKITRKE